MLDTLAEILPEVEAEIVSDTMALDVRGNGRNTGSVSSKRGVQPT